MTTIFISLASLCIVIEKKAGKSNSSLNEKHDGVRLFRLMTIYIVPKFSPLRSKFPHQSQGQEQQTSISFLAS